MYGLSVLYLSTVSLSCTHPHYFSDLSANERPVRYSTQMYFVVNPKHVHHQIPIKYEVSLHGMSLLRPSTGAGLQLSTFTFKNKLQNLSGTHKLWENLPFEVIVQYDKWKLRAKIWESPQHPHKYSKAPASDLTWQLLSYRFLMLLNSDHISPREPLFSH